MNAPFLHYKMKYSLKSGLLFTIILCWLMPMVILLSAGGYAFENSYQNNIHQEIRLTADTSMYQVERMLAGMIKASKAVSYDGTIRNAYRLYRADLDQAGLYRVSNDYLRQNFSRETDYQAVMIRFWDEVGFDAICTTNGTNSNSMVNEYKADIDTVMAQMEDADTAIRFLAVNNRLYMARNLMESNFKPFATLMMLIDPEALFQPLSVIQRMENMSFSIDQIICIKDGSYIIPIGIAEERDQRILQDSNSETTPANLSKSDQPILPQNSQGPLWLDTEISNVVETEDHILTLRGNIKTYNIFQENPWLFWGIVGVSSLLLPLLLILIALFYRHVTRPMETLVRANVLVQAGERGYEIENPAPNQEFGLLYQHFNEMSRELQKQFERSYQEQRAAQNAQIKALQSQINPHFLNNTLEIINWEARIAGNDKISDMIEALSTMLGAALDRDGRSKITLKEELGYVNAYLFITDQRLDGSLKVMWEIDEEMKNMLIPRLILQPIVENAVEHDITGCRGGNLTVRAYTREQRIYLEVEHDGHLSEEDCRKIHALLESEGVKKGHVGLSNVSRRLKLLYGEEGILEIGQSDEKTILVRIHFPAIA